MAANSLPAWLCIVIWIALGYSMIMFNKILLTTWGFSYPFFLTTWHCVVGTILTQILSRTTDLLPAVKEGKVSIFDYTRKLLPVAFMFAYSLVAGNIAYQYISLSYIQMVKAITPVPLLLITFALGREKPSVAQFLIVILVSSGVMLSSIGEMQFNIVGFAIQISAVMADCIRVTLLDILLKDLKLDSLSMLYYTAPTSALFIGMGFIAFELPTFPFEKLTYSFCGALLANGLLAFSLNLAVLFVIGSTSAMVMTISGPMKDILIVISSVIFFHSPVTVLQFVGFAISLAGLNFYRQFKADPAAMHAAVYRGREAVYNLLTCGTAVSRSRITAVSTLSERIDAKLDGGQSGAFVASQKKTDGRIHDSDEPTFRDDDDEDDDVEMQQQQQERRPLLDEDSPIMFRESKVPKVPLI